MSRMQITKQTVAVHFVTNFWQCMVNYLIKFIEDLNIEDFQRY